MATGFNIEQLRQQMQENYTIGMEYSRNQEFQKAIEHLQKALGTCEMLHDQEKQAEILYLLGNTYQRHKTPQDFQMAEEYYRELLSIEGMKPLYYNQVQANRAIALVNKGEYEKALKIFNEIHSLEDYEQYLDAFATETYAYFCLGKFSDPVYYQEAIKYCEKLIAMADPQKHPSELYYAYHNLGHIYYELDENTRSMLAFQSALEYADSPIHRNETYIDMALIFIRISQYELSRAYIDKAQTFFEKSKNLVGLAACLYAKGKWFRHRGRIEEAHNYLELALSGYREKEYYYGIVKTFYELYDMYRKIDSEKAGLYYDQYQFYMNYVSPMPLEPIGNDLEEDRMWN